MSIIGYARVSTLDQNADAQIEALVGAGATKVFTDHASGARTSRPELDACLEYLREGDTLTVWKLDRLGRSLHHLLTVVDQLAARGIEFRSLTESIDTTTSAGKLTFSIVGAFAQFERDIISERTRSGLEHARSQGRRGGRPPALNKTQRDHIIDLYRRPDNSVRSIAAIMNVSPSTVHRVVSGTKIG